MTLFSDQRLARQAEIGLRVKPDIRTALDNGRAAIKTAGRSVFVANGRGGIVDEFRLDEVVRIVGRMPVPPPLPSVPADSVQEASPPNAGALEQVRQLGERRDAGLLTDAEFEAEKAELLDRIGQDDSAAPGRAVRRQMAAANRSGRACATA